MFSRSLVTGNDVCYSTISCEFFIYKLLQLFVINTAQRSIVGAVPTGQQLGDALTIIIPAYNEAASIRDTIVSLQVQTVRPKEIIVVDDCSSDNTAAIARSCGVTVLRPPVNTGSKAGAQNFALKSVRTTFTMAIDADTIVAPDGIEKLLAACSRKKTVAAACGFVLPRHVRSVWERGRYIEYLFAFTFYKPIQNYFGKPLISSGCFSVYRTAVLKEMGGWPSRTMAEDMDLTWSFYQKGYGVEFVPTAICYPIEPENFIFMRKQLMRWSHGFVQNVVQHWRGVMRIPYLRSAIAVSVWDATIASFVYLAVLPILAIIFRQPLFILGYVIDAPVIFIPVLVNAIQRKEVGKMLVSFPSFFILRFINGIFILEAFWSEILMGRRMSVYEKGH